MEISEGKQDCENCTPKSASPELQVPRERRVDRPWENETIESLRRQAQAQSDPVAAGLLGSESDGDRATQPEERIPRRWDRFARLVGEQSVRRLMGSSVTVFGLGGVGSFAVESLARSAIGKLTLVDFDDVCVTNVNRQLQAFPGTVGQSKAKLLAERVRAINPDIVVNPIQAFYDPTNSMALLSPKPDFVIDAIDNVTAKLHLLETCLRNNINAVSVSGSSARLDPTQVRVADVSQTRVDPLARIVRKELGRRGFDLTKNVGLPMVFSEEEVLQPVPPSWDDEGFRCICPHAADSPHACEKRRLIYGSASFVTSAFGLAATSVVIKRLTERANKNF